MTLLWSSATANGSERGSCERTLLQSLQDAGFTKAQVQQKQQHQQQQQEQQHPGGIAVQLDDSSRVRERTPKWSSGVIGMGNPFRPLTRQSPTRPDVGVASRASASASASTTSSSQHHHHHHHQHQHRHHQLQLPPQYHQHHHLHHHQLPPPPPQQQHHQHHRQLHQIDDPASPQPGILYAQSSASTSGSSERSNKRIKLTVRDPTIASSDTRQGRSAKTDGNSTTLNTITTAADGVNARHNNTSPPPTLRPPTRLTFTRPHGHALKTTNGVQTRLSFTQDAVQAVKSTSPAVSGPSPSATPIALEDAPVAPSAAELAQRPTRKTADRRSLRSHDEGSRVKSELAVYFPNYEDVVYDTPQEPELLDVDTRFVIIDHVHAEPSKTKGKGKSKERLEAQNADMTSPAQRILTSPKPQPFSTSVTSPSKDRNRLNGAQVIDFSSIEKSVGHHPKDPLNDTFYFTAHRRAERKEKQLRNIEKERAMHEKAQLERLLDGLQGYDWLRIMGITGVTDTESRKYEQKRDYFISEVQALLQKFKTWKDEERRLKMEKEAAAAAEEEDDDDDEEDEDDSDDEEGASNDVNGSEDEPSSSDVDGAAARQLQLEASGGGKGRGGKGGKGSKGKRPLQHPQPLNQQQREKAPALAPPRPPPPVVYRPPTPEGPFTSFYAKPHLRAAALGKARHGRKLTAFGQALPEVEEREFTLPSDYITPEAIKESARRRRRMKRESLMDGSASK
ncbi:hypothetical protein AAFC00_000451 [Neodothiora populina]|uniref:Something about silencing protein 4 domain-containing protein n=1 Tax=Neodothiora populina TaxID=2781224 RepID=A0ABR3PD39_9PEZI